MGASRARLRLASLKALLPRGDPLPERVWLARHRGICILLWVHVVALEAVGVLRDRTVAECLIGPGIVVVLTAGAMWTGFSRTTRSSLATLGLLSSSAILIEMYDGLIEAHFHFFVTIAVISLYQSWRPYLIGVGYVLVHHLVLGTTFPTQVYNHHAAHDHPWIFALVHGGAILAESIACLVFWGVTEDALDAERARTEALKVANDELAEAHHAVADLVAMLSHDLRVPLTVLMGYSEMAIESWSEMSDVDKRDFVDKVSGVGSSLHTMLEETLAVSVLDAGEAAPRRLPVQVDAAVHEALDGLPRPLPEVDLESLRPATAFVDRRHLDQVLTNLLTNAVKYGGGAFSISCQEGADSVVLCVADSGDGVPPEFVPELFDRFTRSEAARVGAQRGTGLGLYITQKLLEVNGGTIHYVPTEGGGATFCLHLPVTAEPFDPPASHRPAVAAARS